MKVRYAAAGVALSLVGFGLTGCGDAAPKAAQSAEKVDVKQAAAWVDEADAVQLTVRVAATPAAIKALARSGKDGADAKDAAQVADLLGNASIVVVGTPKDDTGLSSVAVKVDGQDLLSMVGSEKDLYLKVDPAQLPSSVTGSIAKQGADVTKVATMLDLFSPGAGDVLRDKWVHVDAAQVKALTGDKRGNKATPTPDEKTAKAAAEAVQELLGKATVTADPADPNHKTATIKGTDLQTALKKIALLDQAKGMGSSFMAHPKAKAEGIPETISVDLYLKDGDLSKVSFDLAQFAETKGLAPVPLEITVDKAEPVTAPAGAKDLDLTKLVEGFKGMLGGDLGLKVS